MKNTINIVLALVLLANLACCNGSTPDIEEMPTLPVEEENADTSGESSQAAALRSPGFTFSTSDTVYLSHSAFEFDSHVVNLCDGEITSDWRITEFLWDSPYPSSGFTIQESFFDSESEIKSYSFEGISFNRIEDSEGAYIKVKVAANESGYDRAYKITVEREMTPNSHLFGVLTIIQRCEKFEEAFNVKVKYKGILFESVAWHNPDGSFIYESDELAQLMRDLSQKERIETVISGNNIVCFYDKDDIEADANLNGFVGMLDNTKEGCAAVLQDQRPIFNSDECRSTDPFVLNDTTKPGFFAVYEDYEFEGFKVYYHMVALYTYYDAWNLSSYNFVDKISSVAVAYNDSNPDACSVLTVWELTDWNFTDRNRARNRVSFIATHDSPFSSCSDLRNLPTLHGTLDNKIGSLSFFFGQYGNYMPNY